ncbi:forkhead box protein P1 [Tribolium madens]|uniref:forkhead box protein P1 n=1 Tax=Tribolium madens TaxID=41895 RepID=UPI001CF73414|nr:forkhead box protein P1 [Tribolium madens]
MSAVMDMYLSASDSMSFQDFLDIDIKSEIESLVGGHNDFSGLNFSELPPLELEDVSDIKWFSSNSNHSNSSLNLDFNGEERTTMVNPNAVMPAISLAQNIRSPSPTLKESHLTFSPSTIKITTMKQEANQVKKDLLKRLSDEDREDKPPVLKTISKVTPIISRPPARTITKPTLLTFRNTINKQVNSSITVAQVSHVTTVKTVTSTNRKLNNNRFSEDGERIYPKPAYSYSCLIAMALKNSRSGSLPVSEIYNFMCKHFPYFITAPNGWKNSVRHNLSLNKCFEKIEKPAINGAQRKGCLWAMNPAKISKMDEEVQKWSRKDPSAIRKAMINPENLEPLERGELKFSCSYDEGDTFGDSCGSAESEEGSDYEEGPKRDFEFVIKAENEDGSDFDIEVSSDLDVEASDEVYEDIEEDQEMLRVEMALAQKELMEYEKPVNSKRRRTYIVQN